MIVLTETEREDFAETNENVIKDFLEEAIYRLTLNIKNYLR